MKWKFILLLCFISHISSSGQSLLQRLESVPQDFIVRYMQEYHDYNPLNVGNLWQFVNYSGRYSEKEIVKDTIIQNKKYFKKYDYMYIYDPYYWERNDSTNNSSYRLDIEDLDEDGDSSY